MTDLKFTMSTNSLQFGMSEQSLEFGLTTTNALGGNYEALSNKPRINGVVLVGNKTSDEIHVQHEMNEITFQDIDEIIFGGN